MNSEKSQNNRSFVSKIGKWFGLAAVLILLFVWWQQNRIVIPENEKQKPVDTVMSTDWQLGNSQAGIKIIEYSDLQCPACQFYSGIGEKITGMYGDRISFAYRHFPLGEIHQNANLAAQATEAAGKQGKFWEMAAKLFSEQAKWSESDKAKEFFNTYASELGLDVQKFQQDLDSKEVKALVEADYLSALVAKVNATPTFFVNGQKMNNLRGPDDLIARIELALQQASESATPTE